MPPKYRNRDEGTQGPAVAKDTSGSPSLVRASRRPPPDPAPAPPEDQQVARAPVTEGRLFDSHCEGQPVVARPGGPSRGRCLPAVLAAAACHGTESEIHFARRGGPRTERRRSTPTDLVKNMLRPSHSASGTVGKPTAADRAGTPAAQRTATVANQTPGTTWMAKKAPASSTAEMSTAGTLSGQQKQDPVHPGTPADSAPSTVVAQTFSNAAGPQTAATQVPSGAAEKNGTDAGP